MMEGRLDRHDLAAPQKYAMARLPETRSLLRFTFEQDQRPGQVAGFLSRTGARSSSQRSCVCGAARRGSPSPRRRLNGARAECSPGDPRPAQAVDRPAHRREATRWKTWFDGRSARLTQLRQPESQPATGQGRTSSRSATMATTSVAGSSDPMMFIE